MRMSRRSFLGAAAAFAPALMLGRPARATQEFVLPPLPYAYAALEPFIDTRTMEIHHDKHHAGYVKNLNAALAQVGGGWGDAGLHTLLTSLDKLPESSRTAIRNNAGGHYNHCLFWNVMGVPRKSQPDQALMRALESSFGSFQKFQEAFTEAAAKRFGSGWGWLTMKDGGTLVIESTANQDNPVMAGDFPVLGVDVWEHAYYLKYQNRRGDYLSAWWNLVDWDYVSKRYGRGLARS